MDRVAGSQCSTSSVARAALLFHDLLDGFGIHTYIHTYIDMHRLAYNVYVCKYNYRVRSVAAVRKQQGTVITRDKWFHGRRLDTISGEHYENGHITQGWRCVPDGDSKRALSSNGKRSHY